MRGIRGATTVDSDDAGQITQRTQELITELLKANALKNHDLISILFSATGDLSAKYPATAARESGLDDVALMGCRELDVKGMVPRCIRVLVHANTEKTRDELRHIFLHGARNLRADLIS